MISLHYYFDYYYRSRTRSELSRLDVASHRSATLSSPPQSPSSPHHSPSSLVKSPSSDFEPAHPIISSSSLPVSSGLGAQRSRSQPDQPQLISTSNNSNNDNNNSNGTTTSEPEKVSSKPPVSSPTPSSSSSFPSSTSSSSVASSPPLSTSPYASSPPNDSWGILNSQVIILVIYFL